MHLSLAFLGWGTPGIPGGIATFHIKVTQFSEPLGMIWKQSLHPGEIRKAMRQWETMAATHCWRLKMSPIPGQEKGPEHQKDPGTGVHSSSILLVWDLVWRLQILGVNQVTLYYVIASSLNKNQNYELCFQYQYHTNESLLA